MSKTLGRFIPALVAASLLTACAEAPTKQTMGTGIGAVGGALIGSLFGRGMGNIAATAAGGLLGAWAGSAAGKAWDKADKEKADEAFEKAHAAPVGQQVAWSNPETGNSGTVTATREGKDETGNTCREYESSITVDGQDQTVKGIACRQTDGSWAAK
ncbi:hypothetical protein A6A04_06165 [Paramagnetospirillum marisnigri]|uniref:Surface antigen domain-containing protein n=1 Tax=Paramagnetospirillum marisnigri TaxID=1285242 RepID=A0A178MF57_9PROT|nr:RT0821/Lpp0805 family surface protein [Paramagnetospirillum marisnigri]OAN46685.1 hypothetical protein A6A04_06165 [Paramagnetospirillum marisnigri]